MNGEHTKPVEARTEDPSVEAIAESEAELAAFPVVIPFEGAVQYFGITKRELFAAMAMQGMMANPNHAEFIHSHAERAALAAIAADALLKELSR